MAMFVIRRSKDNQFYFYFRANNNEIVATSEMYKQKQSAIDGIESIKREAASAVTVDMTNEPPL
ncbi:YegP family protein [Mycolicibacterium fortuitum]|uniref:YegP family protein n=1 Tax=Mycolicibacterium fortuitum TaxID=1766 RepID=UPI000D6BA16D|nr:YegP family protein [Mycolicibacterium fortuitum]